MRAYPRSTEMLLSYKIMNCAYRNHLLNRLGFLYYVRDFNRNWVYKNYITGFWKRHACFTISVIPRLTFFSNIFLWSELHDLNKMFKKVSFWGRFNRYIFRSFIHTFIQAWNCVKELFHQLAEGINIYLYIS